MEETTQQCEQGIVAWQVISKRDLPPNNKLLDMVWAMRRKRRIDTRQVYKWKAHLNVHGGQQEHGVNFWEYKLQQATTKQLP